MTDVVDAATRSAIMARIKGANTGPELALRKALHARGFRFSLHKGDLPGRPDIVLRRWKAAVFVHGCFWHRHPGCRHATTPATNAARWRAKFAANRARDAAAVEALEAAGWRVAILWTCGLGARRRPEGVDALADWLRGGDRSRLVWPAPAPPAA